MPDKGKSYRSIYNPVQWMLLKLSWLWLVTAGSQASWMP